MAQKKPSTLDVAMDPVVDMWGYPRELEISWGGGYGGTLAVVTVDIAAFIVVAEAVKVGVAGAAHILVSLRMLSIRTNTNKCLRSDVIFTVCIC